MERPSVFGEDDNEGVEDCRQGPHKGGLDRKRQRQHSDTRGSTPRMVVSREVSDVESLERIHWRLVNTGDGDDLEGVLSKLVPIMVGNMDTDDRKVQQKVLEILSHVNVRLQGSLEIRLPVEAIWEAYCGCHGVVARTIGMVYLGKAFERCSQEDMWRMVGKIIRGVHGRMERHRGMLVMYAFRSMQGLRGKHIKDVLGMAAGDVFEDVRDLDVVMYYAVKVALYVRESSMVRQTTAGTRPRVVAGLCQDDLKLIESSKVAESVEHSIIGALELVAQAEVEPNKVMMFLLAAASSPYADVLAMGERVLLKTCVFDTSRPTVDVEDIHVIKKLFEMYLGNMDDSMVPEGQRRQPASKVLRGKIIGILCKSTMACNMNPESIMVIHDCVFGDFAGLSTQQQGMQFAVHVLRHAERLLEIAPSIIRHSLRVLETTEGDANMNTLRGFAYQCLGQLAQRDPDTLQEHKLDLMKTCFRALQREPPGVRASVQETVNCLANCFKTNTSDETRARVRELLGQYAASDHGTVRQAALQWILWIFDFKDSFARYSCIVLTSDSNMNISGLALEGLDVEKVKSFQRAKFHQNVDSTMPDIHDMVQTIFKRHPTIAGSYDLILPPKSMEAMLNFLRSLQVTDTDVLDEYFGLLSSCLVQRAPASLQKIALNSLLYLSVMYSEHFMSYFVSSPQIFESMLQHVDEEVASKSARLLGYVSQSLSEEKSYALIHRMHVKLCELVEKPKKQEEALGYLFASGFIQGWRKNVLNLSEDLFNLASNDGCKDNLLQSTSLLCLGYSTFGEPLRSDQLVLIIQDILPMLKKSNHKTVASRVVDALGFISMTMDCKDHEESITDEILAYYCSKDEILLEHCGKALVCVWGGSEMSKEQFLLLHDSPEARPFPCQGTSRNRNKILKFIVNKCISSTRGEARMAGAIWLLSLISNVADTPEISENIPDIQKAFCMLLGDSNDRTQELASRGVTASYEHARDDMKKELVDTLVTILSGNATSGWMRPNHVDQDTQLFEPGSLGSLPEQGGNISTYKEICSLATDLGQPDLIYQFMNLASHQAAADASRGAAYGMASVASIAGDALKPHIKSLIPRLYRSTFDPNPLVRDSMRHIWTILVDDQREVLQEHISEILDLLTKDMTRQQWRVRESAALAMSDILQGVEWIDLKENFETILVCCFRVMDDVKESVALAGQALSRSIMSLSMRFTDPQSNKSIHSKEFLSQLFPVLMKQGIISSVSSIRGYSINMVSKLIKAAGKDTVQDSMEIIVPPLLEALSGMEDARLNYLEQHVQRLGIDGNKFEEERIRYSQTSPVSDTLDICAKYINGVKFCEMSNILSSFLRRAVGSATKAGTANFITASVRRVGSDVSPVAFSLMKVLYEASALENSASVKKAYAVAYANLSKYAPLKKVDSVIDTWLQACKQEDAPKEYMLLTGLMLRSLSMEASDIFMRYTDDIAPVAFLLGYESDSSVKTVWHQVWDELTTATGSGIRAHVIPVAEICLEALSSSHWGRKKAAGEGIVYLSEHAGDLLGNQADQIVSKLLESLPGRLWEGKETLLHALSSVVLTVPKNNVQKLTMGETPIVEALLTACQKQKQVYRTEAFIQLAKVVKHLDYIDLYPEIWPTLEVILQSYVDKLQRTGCEGTSDTKQVELPDMTISLDCVTALWIKSSDSIKTRNPSSAETTCLALLPLLQQTNRPGDMKAVLQAYQAVISCSDTFSISEPILKDVSHLLIAIIMSSKVEDVRIFATNLLSMMASKGMHDSFRQDIITSLQPAMLADKSAAVRSRVKDIVILLNSR